MNASLASRGNSAHAQRPAAIPRPRLESLDNQTPFRVFQFDKMGPGRRFFDVVAIKGSFQLAPGRLQEAESITPFRLCDEAWVSDDPERSSLRYAGDLLLVKTTTDVLLSGCVHAPRGEPCQEWEAGVLVHGGGESLARSVLTVTGPREFRYSHLGGWVLSDSVAATSVPIRYEIAYGGPRNGSFDAPDCRRRPAFRANPSGTGETLSEPDRREPIPAPQWMRPTERPSRLNRPIVPVGFGPIARHWSSRSVLGGTYDASWRARAHEGVIDYPADFDPRFFQCAPKELQTTRYLRGNEWLALSSAAAGFGQLATQLPGLAIGAQLETATRMGRVLAPLDTVTVDLDRGVVDLVWRLTLDQHLGIGTCGLHLLTVPD
ncbi:MAG: DUF2169 domain-containing protein [Myxococcales bacterium]|nr:DUF2169 domain-containing protein [Myxococcales bacterium]